MAQVRHFGQPGVTILKREILFKKSPYVFLIRIKPSPTSPSPCLEGQRLRGDLMLFDTSRIVLLQPPQGIPHGRSQKRAMHFLNRKRREKKFGLLWKTRDGSLVCLCTRSVHVLCSM